MKNETKLSVMDILRFILGLMLSLLVISLIAEGFEFGLVSLINGGLISDMDVYFGIRNQPWFLFLKFIYNGVGLYVGGWLAAKIASRWKFVCVVTLSVVQFFSFIWGMLFSEFAGTTPFWAWILLAVEIPLLILWGGRQRAPTSY